MAEAAFGASAATLLLRAQHFVVRWLGHSSSRGPQAQLPPANLRVSSGNLIAALPASFWWPSKAETKTREEGLQTKEGPEQTQTKNHSRVEITNRDWAPTLSTGQARPHPRPTSSKGQATVRGPTNGSIPTAQNNGSRPATRGDFCSTKHHVERIRMPAPARPRVATHFSRARQPELLYNELLQLTVLHRQTPVNSSKEAYRPTH